MPDNLLLEAEQCRTQAAAFRGDERRLLLRVADVFERLSAEHPERRPIAEIRCW
jgi:hypothetical protein